MSDRQGYTHGYSAPVLAAHRRRTATSSAPLLLPRLRPGMRLLDVGSGAGTITADLARVVGPHQVTAVEVSEEAALITSGELARQQLTEVRVVVADAHELPFHDDAFDVAHVHQVLHHVTEPVQVLAEMRRVTVPGGIVTAREADYGAFRWYPDAPELDRWRELFTAAMRENGGTPDAGRRLLAWCHAAGLRQVDGGADTWCYASPDSREQWAASTARRISDTEVATQLVRAGLAEHAELDRIGQAWRRWARDPAGWLVLLHGQVLARA